MSIEVSPEFEAQRVSDANMVDYRARLFFGDYGLTERGASYESAAKNIGAATADESVFDSPIYSADDLGHGIRSHRNFGDAEDRGKGRGWQGGQRADGSGDMQGVVIRNLDTPDDGTKTTDGKKLAQRLTAPTPGGVIALVTLEQFAIRIEAVGSPGATTIAIYSDVLGLPGVSLTSTTFDENSTNLVDGWLTIDLPQTIVVGGNLWIVIDTAGTATDHWKWHFVNSSTASEFAAENPLIVWAPQVYRLHYRTVFDWTGAPHADFVTVEFPERFVNRIRVYSYPSSRALTGQGVRTFKVTRKSGASYVAVTINKATGADYGSAGLLVAIAANEVSSTIATYFELEIEEVETDGIRLEITQVQAGTVRQWARLVALEIYKVADISDRTLSWDTSQRRDSFLETDQTRTLGLVCENTTKFFSPLIAPTPNQVAAGYLNQEIRPDMEAQIEWGFWNNERVAAGVFYTDKVRISPTGRTASLPSRDFSKWFNRRLSETTFLSRRVEDLIELVANRANFSSSRMVLNETESIVPFFFPNGTSVREEMDLLCEAAPWATVRIDEQGTLRFLTFMPSTSNTGEIEIGSDTYHVDALANVLVVDEKVYIACQKTTGGPDVSVILEYDVIERTFREIVSVGPAGGIVFSNMVVDSGSIFAAQDHDVYKVNLASLAVTTTNLTGSFAGTFNNVVEKVTQSVVTGGFYYFAASVGTDERLCKIDTGLLIASLANLGAIKTAGTTQDTQRIIRWNPVAGTDRLYWSLDRPTLATNTYWDLVGLAMVNDGITRRGVSTDGTVTLYELRSDLTLHSRTTGGTTQIGTHPALESDQVGVGIGFAAGRVWAVRRSATADNLLRVWNVLDLSVFDVRLTQNFQRSVIAEDWTAAAGRLALIGTDGSAATAEPPVLRMIEGPDAPTAETIEARWDGELLEADYELTGERAGESVIKSVIRWTFNPVILGQATTMWRMTQHGSQLSATNPFVVPANQTINLDEGEPEGPGGPRYQGAPIRHISGRRTIYGDFSGRPCAIAAANSVFGPAASRAVPAGEPSLTTPQQVAWTGTGGPLTVTLFPHPTAPKMVLAAGAADAVLTSLEIVALPFLRAGMVVISVSADGVLDDGALLEQLHGENVHEVENDYISDTALLVLAAKEALRLLGRPQHTIPNVVLRPTPQLGLEDVVHAVESESGADLRLQVVGISQSMRASQGGATIQTTADLLALPIASTTGLGQAPNPPPTTGDPAPTD